MSSVTDSRRFGSFEGIGLLTTEPSVIMIFYGFQWLFDAKELFPGKQIIICGAI